MIMKKFILGIATLLSLEFWFIFAQNISPDSIEISVKDPIIIWEATNLKITVIKNWSKMSSYDWSIRMVITEQDWTSLKLSDYTVPNRWTYTFLPSDLWEKEFQRWLEIKKEWTFYIEISDLNENWDKILWKQLIHVIRNDASAQIKDIDIYYPTPNTELVGDKVEIIAMADEIPNSEALVYIDGNIVWTTKLDANWSINYGISNILPWQHTLLLEIPNLEWDIIWRSDKIPFTMSTAWQGSIDVFVDPEEWLMVWDMTTVIVHTDDTVESVKLTLSDRSDSVVMNKDWVWQFSQNVRLSTSWEIAISFETSLFNNSVTNSYNQYKMISVSDVPSITDIEVEKNPEFKTANVTRKTLNDYTVSAYLVNRWVEWSTALSWKNRTEKPAFKFSDVPYDTVINLTITPYRNQQTKHWSASETFKFVLSNKNTCWNWVCDDWETHDTCPRDCEWSTEPTIILWPSCPVQTLSTRTETIGKNHYLIWDKAEWVTKYIIYTSHTPDGKEKIKVYETKDTSYEYPFDYKSKEDVFMYYRIIGICDNWDELELTWATKIQVWPGENFFLLVCLTLLIYSWIKLFRQTE